MNILQKQTLIQLIEEYGKDCSYLAGRQCEGTYEQELKGEEYKAAGMKLIKEFLEAI